MKVRSVIIDSLNLELMDSDINTLSTLIAQVKEHGRNPIVLLNEHGDELLRKIPALLESDLIFAERGARSNEGLYVGINGAGTCTFYLPLKASYSDEPVWAELEKTLIQLPYMNNTHMIIPKSGYPWLVTPAGMLYLKSKNSNYTLESDPDFNRITTEK